MIYERDYPFYAKEGYVPSTSGICKDDYWDD